MNFFTRKLTQSDAPAFEKGQLPQSSGSNLRSAFGGYAVTEDEMNIVKGGGSISKEFGQMMKKVGSLGSPVPQI